MTPPPVAGEVHYVPKELSFSSTDSDRRQVLVHDCDAHDSAGSVAYCSRQDTQKDFGATHLLLDPEGVDATAEGATEGIGFPDPTYVYPAALTPVPVDYFGDRCGKLSDARRDELHEALSEALGIGTGTCWSRTPPRGATYPTTSWRGSIVGFVPELLARLNPEGEDDEGADRDDAEMVARVEYGIVLTRHDLSSHQHAYQTIVPVTMGVEPLSDDEWEAPWAPWMDVFGAGVRTALVLVPEAFYCHPSALQRLARPRVVPPDTLAKIEEILLGRLRRCAARGSSNDGQERLRTGTAP